MIGYVYKIESDCKQVVYIGSTITKLSYRFGSHKINDHCTISKYLNDPNYTFSNGCELIKEYEVVDKKHLYAYEQLAMNNHKNNINYKNAFKLTFKEKNKQYKKEWAEINKDKLIQYKKEYYQKNKNRIKQKSKNNHQKSKELLIEVLSFM